MASTETRTGFRLPWVSETHAAPGAETDEATDGTVATVDPDGGADATTMAGADPVAGADPAGSSSREPAATDSQAPLGTPARAAAPAAAPAAARRPSKFLADLARAMRAAAETERDEILERFRTEAKTFVETMHERTAVETAELRATADGDIGGIREWSKAEIARVREETDRRITDRRAQLEQEIEAHGALIERRIEHINASVETFEAEMSRFFEGLLAEEDPAYFAEMAGDLPEPPSLEAIASEDIEAPQAQAEAVATDAGSVAPDARAVTSDAEAEPALAGAATEAMTDDRAAHGTAGEETTEDEAEHNLAAEATLGADVQEGLPAESAASGEAADADVVATAEAEATGSAGADADAATATGDVGSAQTQPVFDEDTLPLDPRVAALGLTPDFGAAEAEAAADLTADLPDDGSNEEVPAFDEATIASRLAGLVPTAPAATDLVETRVVVSGLVSVASIAGFKRGLGRLPGVQSVSVSSGPDGEFVFAATCAAGVDLAGAIATMQGFSARVTGASDGRLEVLAHDPDAA